MPRPHFGTPFLVLVSTLTLACSSSSAPKGSTATDAGAASPATAPAGSAVEHGAVVDYMTFKPLAGLTVTDDGVSATTDSNGHWSLVVPADALLQPTVTGPQYAPVLFPDAKAAGADVDYGTSVMPDSSSFQLEEVTLPGFDSTKALVHVVVVATGACASATGGTISVVTPPGASFKYFASSGIPGGGVSSFQDVQPNRPVAVVYNIDVGANLQVAIAHPSCKQVAYPATYNGKTYPGTVRAQAAEPGGYNAALVAVMD
jgi:hypothetical protein